MMKAEVLTWPVTAVILVLAFGTLAAAGLPLVLTAAGLVTSMGILYGITRFTDLSIWTFNFAMMFALALGIDYALFIVTRFRENMHDGMSPEEATVEAVDTSGRAVVFAGITVMISLLGLFVMGVAFVRGLAIAGATGVLMMMLAAITLLPALLGFVQHRIEVTTRAAAIAAR